MLGLLYITMTYRLLPATGGAPQGWMRDEHQNYVAELRVPPTSPLVGTNRARRRDAGGGTGDAHHRRPRAVPPLQANATAQAQAVNAGRRTGSMERVVARGGLELSGQDAARCMTVTRWARSKAW